MLTERIIRDTKPRVNDYILWDGQVKGLGGHCQVEAASGRVRR